MNKSLKVIDAVLGGMAAGLALAFIVGAVIGLIAVLTGTPVGLPGFLIVVAGTENGALALEVQPNLVGITFVVVLTMLASVLQVARRGGAEPGSSRHA